MEKHLVITFNSLDIGGIERKIVDLSNHLPNLKITLILRHCKGELLSQINPRVNIIESSLYPPILTYQLLTQRPDLILTFGNYCAICTLLSYPFGKIIVSEDSSIDLQIKSDTWPKLRRLLVKLTYPLAHKIITLTAVSQSKLNKIISPHSSVILPNWLPFSTNTRTTNKKIDILFVGRFVDQKDPLTFLKYTKMLKGYRIKMVGFGPLLPKINKYISKNSLKITPDSNTINASRYFQQSKILLITSKHEGFPLIILESLVNNCLPIFPYHLQELHNFFKNHIHLLAYDSDPATKIKYFLNHPKITKKITSYYKQKIIANQQILLHKTTDFIRNSI